MACIIAVRSSFRQDVCDYGGGGDTDGARTTFRYGGMTNFGNLCCITYLDHAGPGAPVAAPPAHKFIPNMARPTTMIMCYMPARDTDPRLRPQAPGPPRW